MHFGRSPFALLVILLAWAALLLGCPSTEPTSPAIDDVVVEGDPNVGAFMLKIKGRGFTTELDYNLGDGQGQSNTRLEVDLFRASTLRPAEDVRLLSPREIYAEFTGALEEGLWGVRIIHNGKMLVERKGVLDILSVEPGEDAGPREEDSAVPGEDAAERDALTPDVQAEADAGLPDTGRPDSGIGPFIGNFGYRQKVDIENLSAAIATAYTTVVVPIAHQTLAAASMAKRDASDIALYLGDTQLPHQWDDRAKIDTDQLALVARIPIDVDPGLYTGAPLVLYFGDPAINLATDDDVFEVAERFAVPIDGTWHNNNNEWDHCDYNRPAEAAGQPDGAYCIFDGNDTPYRRTLGSTRYEDVTSDVADNHIYELTLFTSGAMLGGANDVFYLSYNDVNNSFADSTLIAVGQWTGFAPNAIGFQFEETTGQTRTIDGWRYGATPEWWKRSTARFRTPYNETSIHFRFISNDGATFPGTFVAIDDLVVRLALEPEWRVTLGPVEPRNP